jgi:putative chitinase
MGNGDEKSGDGYCYRGRGYIMLTGKSQYEQFNKYDLCTKDVIKDPDYVARYAREKYMYSKDGEIILRLPEDE